MSKRIMVDMSATLIHHGHIRLLKKASEFGKVIVGLTSDDEIISKKGYQPELSFKHRKEVIESIKYVAEVVAVPWLLDELVLDKHNIDFLVHGFDNSNLISKTKLKIFPRTKGVSSSNLREKSSLIANNIRRNILLNPGPGTTTDTVKMAQVVPDICPREKEFGDLMGNVSNEITKIVGDVNKYTTILFGGSGTSAVESVLSSIVPNNGKILIINNGSYGERMCQIVEAYGIDFIEFCSSSINPIEVEKLERVIRENDSITHLAVVHNETTTGLLNNLDELGVLSRKYHIELIVDAMSSYAAIPIDMQKQNISYLLASSNKNIQGMAGIGFVIANKKSISRIKYIKPRNFYLNLYAQYKNFIEFNQMRFTPPVQTLYALKQAIVEIKEEGVNNRYKRYSKSWKTLTDGLKELNLKYLVDDKCHSKIITSVYMPNGVNFDEMHDYFYDKGFTIYPGKVSSFDTFRIANIGDINYKDISLFLILLKSFLADIA